MEESQSTSFHIKHFNQSVMTLLQMKCLVGNTGAGLCWGVSRSRDSCFGGVNPHPSPERQQDTMLGAQGLATHLAAPHTTNGSQ